MTRKDAPWADLETFLESHVDRTTFFVTDSLRKRTYQQILEKFQNLNDKKQDQMLHAIGFMMEILDRDPPTSHES